MSETNHRCVACVMGPMRMPFGKHSGELVTSLPEDYLRWLISQGWAQVLIDEFEHLKHVSDDKQGQQHGEDNEPK